MTCGAKFMSRRRARPVPSPFEYPPLPEGSVLLIDANLRILEVLGRPLRVTDGLPKLTAPEAAGDALVCFQKPVSTVEMWVRDDLEGAYVHLNILPEPLLIESRCTRGPGPDD